MAGLMVAAVVWMAPDTAQLADRVYRTLYYNTNVAGYTHSVVYITTVASCQHPPAWLA
jgi:formate/nitrite transporter FocA (FNT family)